VFFFVRGAVAGAHHAAFFAAAFADAYAAQSGGCEAAVVASREALEVFVLLTDFPSVE
jgi:hypothetical protein